MKKLIFTLCASISTFSYAKSIPNMTLYEYLNSNNQQKEAVSNYVSEKYGLLSPVVFKGTVAHLELEHKQCQTVSNNDSSMKKLCEGFYKNLKQLKLKDIFNNFK